jgi:Zn-dependent protease/predicted transcriptional regulator
MKNYTVARVWGIPVQINISLIIFVPILAWIIGSGGQIEIYADMISGLIGESIRTPETSAGRWTVGVLAALGLFVSVLVHELGHSWAALRYGVETESITLWLLGGIASLSSVPKEWNKEFWIAIAGPTTSIGVAAVCYVAAVSVPTNLTVPVFVLGWLAIMNLVLAVFNLLPAFPMDGGRILRALLARNRPHVAATQTAARIGVYFGVFFAVVGVLSFSPLLVLLAFFIYGAAKTESSVSLLESQLEGMTAMDLMGRESAVLDAETTVSEFADRMLLDRRTSYAVTEDGRTVGVVSLDDVRGITRDEMDTETIGDLLGETVHVPFDQDAFEVLMSMNQAGANTALVEEDGDVIGTVVRSELGSLLEIRDTVRVPQ